MRKAIASCNSHIEFPTRSPDVDAGRHIWAAGLDRRMHPLEVVMSRNSTVGGSLHHVQSVLVGKKYSNYVEVGDGGHVGGARHYLMATEMEACCGWACKADPLSVLILFLLLLILTGIVCLSAPISCLK